MNFEEILLDELRSCAHTSKVTNLSGLAAIAAVRFHAVSVPELLKILENGRANRSNLLGAFLRCKSPSNDTKLR